MSGKGTKERQMKAARDKREYVCIMSDADRASRHYMADLRHAASEAGIPRRRWVNAIHDALSEFEGEIYTFDHKDWFAPEVADVFGNEDDSARWVSNFAKPRDKQKPIRAFQKNISDRVTLIDLYFRLVYPEQAALFGYREIVAQQPHHSPRDPAPSDPPGGLLAESGSQKASSFMLCYFKGIGVIYVPIPDIEDGRDRVSAFLRARANSLGSRAKKFRSQDGQPNLNAAAGPLRKDLRSATKTREGKMVNKKKKKMDSKLPKSTAQPERSLYRRGLGITPSRHPWSSRRAQFKKAARSNGRIRMRA